MHSDLGVLRDLVEDDFTHEVAQGGILLPNPLAKRNINPNPTYNNPVIPQPHDDDDDCVIVLESDDEPSVQNRSLSSKGQSNMNIGISGRNYMPQPKEYSTLAEEQTDFNHVPIRPPVIRRRTPTPPMSFFTVNYNRRKEPSPPPQPLQRQFQSQHEWIEPQRFETEGGFRTPMTRDNPFFPPRKARPRKIVSVNPWQNTGTPFGNMVQQDNESHYRSYSEHGGSEADSCEFRSRSALGYGSEADCEEFNRYQPGLGYGRGQDESNNVDDEGVARVYRNPIDTGGEKSKGGGQARRFGNYNQNQRRFQR